MVAWDFLFSDYFWQRIGLKTQSVCFPRGNLNLIYNLILFVTVSVGVSFDPQKLIRRPKFINMHENSFYLIKHVNATKAMKAQIFQETLNHDKKLGQKQKKSFNSYKI